MHTFERHPATGDAMRYAPRGPVTPTYRPLWPSVMVAIIAVGGLSVLLFLTAPPPH